MGRSTKKQKKKKSTEEERALDDNTEMDTSSPSESKSTSPIASHLRSSKKKKHNAPTIKEDNAVEETPSNKKKKRKHHQTKPKSSSLDVMVHRVRCLSYQPKPILCMASSCEKYLALARDDGSVELKSPTQKFRTLTTIHGQPCRPVHVMVWISEMTCIGGSMDGTLFVLDWQHSAVANVTASGGGGVFALASLSDKRIATGCEDGSIRVYLIEEENKLNLSCTIATGGAAVLSLAFSNKRLYAGLADGTIRRYDESCEQNKWTSTLRMTVECLGRSTPTRVWSLLALSDNTVVSGDSLGHVQFWDGDTGTLISSCNQSETKADVLCLVSSNNQRSVFASGVDSRIVCMELSSGDDNIINNNTWILTHAQRPHTHDVKAMAIAGEQLCSGGLDTKLCVYPTNQKFGKTRPKIMYPWPSISPIAVAPRAKLLALKRQDRVDLFALDNTKKSIPQKNSSVPINNSNNISTLEIKSSCNLVCCDISADGKLLAVSNALDGLMMFLLKRDGDSVIPTKVTLPSEMTWPCEALKFDLNGKRLVCATSSGSIMVLGIIVTDDKASVEVQHKFDIPADEQNNVLFPIHALHVSHDGSWLVSCQSGMNCHGAIHVFSIGDNKYKHWWTLPKLDSPHTSAEFLGNNKLAISCVNFGFYLFDIQEQKLSSWSESMGFPVAPSLPHELVNRNDYPVRFGFNKATPNKLLMGSFGAFCTIDLDKPIPQNCRIFPETHVRGGNRQRQRALQQQQSESNVEEEEEQNHNCTICLRYNSMLYMNFMEENELLIVEQPWLNVVASFPEALERKVYGS